MNNSPFHRAKEHLLQGLAYALALHRQDKEIKAIARTTLQTLVFYQPVPASAFHPPTWSEQIVDYSYTLLAHHLSSRYQEDARRHVLLNNELLQKHS